LLEINTYDGVSSLRAAYLRRCGPLNKTLVSHYELPFSWDLPVYKILLYSYLFLSVSGRVAKRS